MATETDKVNTGALATLVAVGAFAMIGISLSLVALVRDQLDNERVLKDKDADRSYLELKAQQTKKLEEGEPIRAAMAAVVSEYSKDPSSATPAPAVSAAPVVPGAVTAPTAGAGATEEK